MIHLSKQLKWVLVPFVNCIVVLYSFIKNKQFYNNKWFGWFFLTVFAYMVVIGIPLLYIQKWLLPVLGKAIEFIVYYVFSLGATLTLVFAQYKCGISK